MYIREYKNCFIVPETVKMGRKIMCDVIIRPKSDVNNIIRISKTPFKNVDLAVKQAQKFIELNKRKFNKVINKNKQTKTIS